MQILSGLDGLTRLPPGAVASIGNFDGVHLGHRRLLQAARHLSESMPRPTLAVITFEPHPLTALRPAQVPPRLTPVPIKQELLAAAGVDYLINLAPDPDVLGLTAEQFWQILRDCARLAHLVEGASFRFGKGAAGNIEKLKTWSAGSPLHIHIVESVLVPLLNLEVAPVSSSLIRVLLTFGRVRDAAICLGRPYLLQGVVGKGFERGRTIGVPTANLKIDDQMLPADAVYSGRCTVDGVLYPAAVNIGTTPTFGETVRQVEAHLIGFTGDLYGRTLRLELCDWLRDQQKFPGAEALKAQLARDIARVAANANLDPARPIAIA
jgi:riboflavin kinase/FMN adenylyltransferase